MSNEDKNDLFYVCSLIEYIARVTKNRISDIVKISGKNYQRLIEDVCNGTNDLVEDFYNVMTSFITDEMSNYNSSFFIVAESI